MILAALLWTALSLQWSKHEQHANLAHVVARIDTALDEWQQRATALATLAGQLVGEGRGTLQRATLEASLRTALAMPGLDLDGILLVDPAGRPLVSFGDGPGTPLRIEPERRLPALLWADDALVLAGRMPAAANRPGHTYQAALRPTALALTLARAIDGGAGHAALLLQGGTLVGVAENVARRLGSFSGLESAGEAPALLAPSGIVSRLVAPLPSVDAAVVVEAPPTPEAGGLRKSLLLTGALLVALQLGITLLLLLWIGRQLRRMRERHAQETDHARDRALRSIKDMLGALPATLYRAELFADRSVSLNSISDNVERLTGFSPSAITRPHAWRERVVPADHSILTQHMDRLYRDGESSAEYRFLHADGRTIWLRAQARIVAVGPHGGADIMGYMADISGEKMLQAQAVASAKLATLGRMASALAHEITQPISVMMLAAENALDAHETEGRAAMPVMVSKLNRILEQTQRAQSLVEHLRVFGRANDGATEPVDMVKAIDGALLLSASVLKRAGIHVENLVPARLPLVSANQVMLEQVIMNLVINARDAMLRVPDAQRRLTLRAGEIPGRRIELRVTDTGRGLSPEALARLFEPFFTTKPAGQGMGLGLSICHGIIRSFGGEITGENVEGGASFSIRLPVAEAAPKEEPSLSGTGTSKEVSHER